MTPKNHIFLFKSIIDLHNEQLNHTFAERKGDETNLVSNLDSLGRATFGHNFTDDVDTASSWSYMQTERTMNSIHYMDIAPENAQNAFSEHHALISLQSKNYMLCDKTTVYRSLSIEDQNYIDTDSNSGASVLSPGVCDRTVSILRHPETEKVSKFIFMLLCLINIIIAKN